MLNSHPAIHAPHELHLRYLTVQLATDYTKLAITTLGYSRDELKHMLWDRLLFDQLQRSSKSLIVDKSPSNTFVHDELRQCWPEARFIVLRRHPADIAASIVNARDGRDQAESAALVCRYGDALDAALQAAPGTPVVRYEDLTCDPVATCRRLCDFLGVEADDTMVDYGHHDHGSFVYGIGDWGDRIRSGHVHPPATPRASREIADPLVDLCQRWGYAVEPAPSPPT